MKYFGKVATGRDKFLIILATVLLSLWLVVLFGGIKERQATNNLAAATNRCRTSDHILDLKGKIFVASMTTDATREKGLSGHAPLASDEGMLFVFDGPAQQNFWMKEMLFPIDMIWLDSNMRVVGAAERATPESYPTIFSSPSSTKYVLEVPAGEYAARSLMLGDQATLADCATQ